jgi:hypothetical protein
MERANPVAPSDQPVEKPDKIVAKEGPDITTLQILRDRGVISQEGYDSAVKAMLDSTGRKPGKQATFVVGKWATTLYGFVDADYIYDTTEGLIDIPGSPLIPRAGTYAGNNSRTQFSVRNSRIGFRLGAPEYHGMRASALFESDFVVQTAPVTYVAPVTNTENNFFTNSVLRIRHFYLKLENPIVDLLFGQTWHLFGWQSAYHPSTDQPQGIPGELYSRTPQIRATKTINVDAFTFDAAIAASRPPERDGAWPEFEFGVHFAFNGWKATQTMGATGTTVSPLSVAVTGDLRNFSVPEDVAKPLFNKTLTTSAIAVGAFVPVLPASEDHKGNSLSLLGEFSTGYGIPDMYTGLATGVAFLPLPGGAVYPADIDANYLTFDANGNLHAIQETTWRAGIQYYFPGDGKLWVSGNYANLASDNAWRHGPGSAVLGHLDWFDVNVMGDLTPSIRLGVEYANYNTMYADQIHAINHRLFGSAFYIF